MKKRESLPLDCMRQRYHFMAPKGWINDPNGLIFYRGKYHLFYQYNPGGVEWDQMHWGHAVSGDLLHWKHLPEALAPGQWYDNGARGGCFSGTALEEDGLLYLFYTGVHEGPGGTVQAQCMACSRDGLRFEKYAKNPVLYAPEGIEEAHFRDPKVWKEGNIYYMLCAGKRNGLGSLLLFRSQNKTDWTYVGSPLQNDGSLGVMWECPDFFCLGGRDVICLSLEGAALFPAMEQFGQGTVQQEDFLRLESIVQPELSEAMRPGMVQQDGFMQPDRVQRIPDRGDYRVSVAFVGKLDRKTGTFLLENMCQIDYGTEYYAPQTLADEKGRRLMLAWGGGWPWMPWWRGHGPTENEGWRGFMALPREVRMDADGKLYFLPVSEAAGLRKETLMQKEDFWLRPEEPLCLCREEAAFEAELEFLRPIDGSLQFVLRQSGCRKTTVKLDFEAGVLSVDKTHSDGYGTGITRSPLWTPPGELLRLHLYLDRCGLELFADAGRTVHSCNIYAPVAESENRVNVSRDMLIGALRVYRLG